MGNWGWFPWLSEKVEKLKLLRSMTTDEAQLKIIDEMIADMETKKAK